MDPRQIIEAHEVEDETKLSALVESMEESGWQGRPILAHDDDNGIWAWTGSHRIAAARIANVDVPVHLIDLDTFNAFCTEWDMTYDDLCDDYDKEWALEEMGDAASLAIFQEEPNV